MFTLAVYSITPLNERLMKQLLLSCIFCGLAFCVTAQDFKSAVGLRFGYPYSASYKVFLSETNAVEAYAGLRPYIGGSWIAANGAYLIHKDLDIEEIDLENLQWYYGFGAGVQRVGFTGLGLGSSTFFNVSGYLGLSYTFDDIPLNISVDWVPTVFLNGFEGLNTFGAGYGALAARYVLSEG